MWQDVLDGNLDPFINAYLSMDYIDRQYRTARQIKEDEMVKVSEY